MRSLSRGGIAGNAKLNGKRAKHLACGCCVLQDFRAEVQEKRAAKEIQEFKKMRDAS